MYSLASTISVSHTHVIPQQEILKNKSSDKGRILLWLGLSLNGHVTGCSRLSLMTKSNYDLLNRD